MLLAKPHVKAALGRHAMAKATDGDGQISEQWLRDLLIAGATHGPRDSQVQCLAMLCRRFFKDKGDAEPADDLKKQAAID